MRPDDQEIQLPGGSSGGAVRVGSTVRRRTGPWTPAVHALLGYLEGRVPGIPRVLGHDEQGREILSYLPGRVVDGDAALLSAGLLLDNRLTSANSGCGTATRHGARQPAAPSSGWPGRARLGREQAGRGAAEEQLASLIVQAELAEPLQCLRGRS